MTKLSPWFIFLTFIIPVMKICTDVKQNKTEQVNLHPPAEVMLFHSRLGFCKKFILEDDDSVGSGCFDVLLFPFFSDFRRDYQRNELNVC